MPARWRLLFGVSAAALVAVLSAILISHGVGSSSHKSTASKQKKSLTLRVNGISSDTADKLESELRGIIARDSVLQSDVTELRVRSLVPQGTSYFCATVPFRSSLSADLLCFRLQKSSGDSLLHFSNKYEGLTPLYADPNGVDIDIVAVTGLGGHALGCWKSPSSDDVWLRDYLPKDLPNLRVLVYGYDTTLPGSLSKQSIEDLGGALLEHIIAFRAKDETSHRPILLIGHSLGGLLIKEALIRAERKQSEMNALLSKACYGLLFFGVPNLGLRYRQLRTLVRGQPNELLVNDLLVDGDSEPSTFLKRLADQFSETCKGKYQVVTFFERELSPTVELDPDGQWRKTGPPSLLVTQKSTTSTGLVAAADEDNIPLNTNHSGLVRYDSRSHGHYALVSERVRRLVEEAKKEVPRRFAEHNLYQSKSEGTQHACLKSLAFNDMDSRPNEVADPARGTCQWFLEHETFIQWTRQRRGLLWIKGKPGSGKSTLLRYAIQHVPVLYGADTIPVYFFFHGRGHELQKSMLGLYRCLLHQLLRRVPGALSDMMDYFDTKNNTEGKCGISWQWHVSQLQKFLHHSLSKTLQRFPVALFVDALDEGGEEAAVELIDFFKSLLAELPWTGSRIGIFFSCRHYPILELDEGLTISVDKENTSDIGAYVSRNCPDPHLEQMICERAQGVFMWAQFVVKRVLHLNRQGAPLGEIEREIERTPSSLEELYRKLINGAESPPQTMRLMQWVCFSIRPLTPVELQWAMAVPSDCSRNSITECEASDEFITCDQIHNRISALSCGLAEVVHSEDSKTVQVIHQSVKDFFATTGWSSLSDAEPSKRAVPVAHCQLARSCLHYLRLYTQDSNSARCSETSLARYPLLGYAITSVTSHLQLGDPGETAPQEIFQLFQLHELFLKPWLDLFPNVPPPSTVPGRGLKLVHIASQFNLVSLLCYTLSADGNGIESVVTPDSGGMTPLSWAAMYGNEAVTEILLATGRVVIDSKNRDGQTPLLLAAMSGSEAVAKLLLATGKVDINSRDNYGWTPLSWAAWNDSEAVAKLLLATGKVDVDSRTNAGETPLSLAAQMGNEEITRSLLATGKADVYSRDAFDSTPLDLAIGLGREAVAELLFDAIRVDVKWKSSEFAQKIFGQAAKSGILRIVKSLLNMSKIDVDLKDKDGRTPLAWASYHQNKPMVELLLNTKRVDVNAKDNFGFTPLLWAADENKKSAVVQVLLNVDQVDVNSRHPERGWTPLLVAVKHRNEAVIRMLLDTGRVEVNSKDAKYGRTPLLWAVEDGCQTVVKMLLQHPRVDLTAVDVSGNMALQTAVFNQHEEVERLLMAHNAPVASDFYGLQGLFSKL